MPFSVLVPITITSSNLYSSTVAENDYSAWSSGTTYGVGSAYRVISTTTHRIYESMAAGNLNHDPTDINNRIGTTPWWLDIGPTNRYGMFDDQVNTQTVAASPLTVVLRPGFFSGLAFLNMDADTISVTVKDAPGGNVIYTHAETLEESAPDDYWDYFFLPFEPRTALILSGIEPYYLAEVSVTFTKASGSVKCGVMAVGNLRNLGVTQKGAKIKPKGYGHVDTDSYGNNVFVDGKSAVDMTLPVQVERSQANSVVRTITNLLNKPCVWIGSEDPQLANLLVYGVGSGEMSHDEPTLSNLSMNILGVI